MRITNYTKEHTSRGTSTFTAALLMVILAVAAGTMLYASTMGYIGKVAGKPELNAMQAQSIIEQRDEVWIYLKNIGQGLIVLDDVQLGTRIYINDKYPDSLTPWFERTQIAPGETTLIKIPTDNQYFNKGETNTIKIVTIDGTYVLYSIKIF